MWISRKVYENLLLDNAKLREESRVLNGQNHTLTTSMEWFMVRTTQLERERAVILNHYMDVKIEVPNYQPVPTPRDRDEPKNIPEMLGTMGFADVGDAEAKRLGIGWDRSGAVVATK